MKSSLVDVQIYVGDGELLDGADYSARIGDRLSKAGLTFALCDLDSPPLEHAPPKLAYVLTGGSTSVNADERWMRSAVATTRDLVAEARRGGCAVVGICLGSQIIAEAVRPRSIMSTSGMEIGLTPVTDPHAPRDQIVVPSFHYEAISPEIGSVPGVRIEWHNAHTPVQGFSYGERVFGYQFHPELSSADVRRLIAFNADIITEWHGDVDAAYASVDRYADVFDEDLFDRVVIDRLHG